MEGTVHLFWRKELIQLGLSHNSLGLGGGVVWFCLWEVLVVFFNVAAD